MDKKEFEFLISEGEGYDLEFKEKFSDEVIESLVAFANHKGGRVVIGIDKKKILKGVSINKESVQNWINEIKTKTFHALLPLSRIEKINGKNIVIFEIQESQIKPVSFKGRFFIRKENSNHLMNASEITIESFNSQSKSSDAVLVEGFTIKDLNFAEIKRVIDLINKRKEVKININIIDFLVKYNLIRDNKPTLASLLLFSDKSASKRVVQAGVFQSDLIIKDELVCDNYLILQADELFEFVKKHISKMTFIVDKPQNIQKWEYPLEALRELIINLIVHRDYSQTATIKIFPDKIIFLNYGGLPQEYKVEDFILGKRSSYTRNKLITRVFKDAGIIEEYSSGLARVVNSCKENSNRKPIFNVDRTSFSVEIESMNKDKMGKLAGETTQKTVEKTSEKIILLIKQNPEITRKELGVKLGEMLGVKLGENNAEIIRKIAENKFITSLELSKYLSLSITAIENNISKLKKIGIIKRIGADKGGYWEVVENNEK